jgi:uncharacterized membrane protein
MIKSYIVTLVSLLVLDGFWIGVIAKNFYHKYLGFIFAEKFVLWPAGIFYLLYAFGIVFFVVTPALEAKSIGMALMRGALLGLIAYATYDLTNQATISKWPVIITVVDIIWGAFVTMLVSGITYYVISKI